MILDTKREFLIRRNLALFIIMALYLDKMDKTLEKLALFTEVCYTLRAVQVLVGLSFLSRLRQVVLRFSRIFQSKWQRNYI